MVDGGIIARDDLPRVGTRARVRERVCVILTPVTSMTLMAASCPVLTWRPW